LRDLKAKLGGLSSDMVEEIVLAMAVFMQANDEFKDAVDMINARINSIC
jgi:hypothetical protein